MKRIAVAFAVLAALAVAPAASANEGAELFQKKCAVCHGKDGKGQTPMGQKMQLKDLTQVKASEGDVAKVVTEGKGKMTPFKGRMTDAEIQAVSKYVSNGLK
jgi:cytochrome c6